ncbi:ABC transporter permease [Clostridium oryzae]|uniref:D-allose transport system permease protein AlsC n=1 Tax=Clostridium oryzae TaxID=1450648 RepID=A0A1V4IKZ2_9CLOT|nr:ABC transporter permease [Clostridium oryzae]OPJ60494.1 D-allose transport system permease protein AlsC [Clostridium oryzae]
MSKIKENKFLNAVIKVLRPLAFPIVSIVLSLFISVFFVLWAKGYSINQYFSAGKEFFSIMWTGSFGSKMSIMNTIYYTSPLVFTGISNAVAFKTGLFNIGAEGQFVMGMLAAAFVGVIPGLPAVIHIPLVLFAGLLAGGLWAAVPGYIKAKSGTSEVINTIMMNYIAMYVVNFLILRTPLGLKGKARTFNIKESAQLFNFMPQYQANAGIIVGIVLAIILAWILWKTTVGYEMRAVGNNLYSAEYSGINVKKNIVLAMVMSGLLSGIGGAAQVAGGNHFLNTLSGLPGYGFTGMAVALLAKNNPIGCIFSAVLFGTLDSSSKILQINGIPKEIVELIQAIIIIFVATDYIVKYISQRRKKGATVSE